MFPLKAQWYVAGSLKGLASERAQLVPLFIRFMTPAGAIMRLSLISAERNKEAQERIIPVVILFIGLMVPAYHVQ